MRAQATIESADALFGDDEPEGLNKAGVLDLSIHERLS
jgi:hypothetical protein